MAWSCADRPERIISGKRGKVLACRPASLWWIGSRSLPPVQQGRPGAVGRPPRIGGASRSSKSNVQSRTADRVDQCTSSQSTSPRRVLTVRPQPQYQALQAARQRQATQEFKTAYAARAGIEGTLSQGTRACRLRQARYCGLEKVHLQQVLTATALNLCHMHARLTEQARAKTRQAAFARLAEKRA